MDCIRLRAQRANLYAVGAIAVVVVVLCAACGSSSNAASRPPAHTRIVLVIEENHAASTIYGAHDLPNFNRLATDGTVLTRYFAVTHPSLPNYLALTSGSIHGLHDDCGTCSFTGANLGEQLQQAGISWKLYAQGLPGPCPHAASHGAYAHRHVPFLYYDGIEGDASLCSHIVPYSQFATDARDGTLPMFAMVIPDVDHDMHGRVEKFDDSQARATADSFIGTLYSTLRSSPAWQQDTRLVVTWDEAGSNNPPPRQCCGGDATGGRVPTFVVGPRVAHATDGADYDHYALLRSIEDLYHLDRLGAAAHATSRDIPAITG